MVALNSCYTKLKASKTQFKHTVLKGIFIFKLHHKLGLQLPNKTGTPYKDVPVLFFYLECVELGRFMK